MINKKILHPDRIRRIAGGFSFIPHRFLADGFFVSLTPHELLLYFLLVLAGDRNGISFYSYDKMLRPTLCDARSPKIIEPISKQKGCQEQCRSLAAYVSPTVGSCL